VAVTPANAETLWADRRNQFFKPARGYGSKATYSGAKLTRRVWSEILAGGYVAQAFAPPGRRRIYRDGALVELKVDVRLYTYEGEVLLVAARLYQGQTTNMRTAGGGIRNGRSAGESYVADCTERSRVSKSVQALPERSTAANGDIWISFTPSVQPGRFGTALISLLCSGSSPWPLKADPVASWRRW